MPTPSLRRASAPLFIALLLALLAYLSPVSNANADPHFSLIVSQSLLEHATLKLDGYRVQEPDLFEHYHWQMVQVDGHDYYNYPLTPSLLALPAVGVARIAGADMLDAGQNHFLQNILSATVCALVFLLLFLLIRSYLPYWASLLIASVSMLGSTLISTLATAYWNLGPAVAFVLLILILLARYDSGKAPHPQPYLLGLLLFAAYTTRPSAALLISVVFLYLLLTNRPALIRTAGVALLGFMLFVLFSRLQYGLWLPVYYTTSQWLNPQDGILRALYGVSFSPSRGLFVFSPVFLLALAAPVYWSRLKHRTLYTLCALWLALHIFSVALTRQWHGGYSFGPRLLTDAVPALVLMTAILWHSLRVHLSPARRRLAIACYLIFALPGIFIHTIQGPFNVKAALWNAFPDIDAHPQLLFDWRYPQFLTTLNSFHERRLSFHRAQIAANERQLAPYEWNQTLQPNLQLKRDLWHGWWPNDRGEWWSETAISGVIFAVSGVDSAARYALEIEASSAMPHTVHIVVNGHTVGQFVPGPDTTRAKFVFDGSLIAMHNTARITFVMPELRETPFLTAYAQTFSTNPHQLGLKNAGIRLAPMQPASLPEK